MAPKAMGVRALVLLTTAVMAKALIMDQDATNGVVSAALDALSGGEVVLVLRGPRGTNPRREELLHAKTSLDVASWLYYNKKSNKVTLETLHGGHMKSVSWGLGSSPGEHLLLVVTSNKVRLIVNCRPLHWHDLSGKYDLLDILSSEKLKLYHEENSPIHIYGSEKAALETLNCEHQEAINPPSLLTVDDDENEETHSDMVEIKDFVKIEERRKRKDEMQGDQYRDNFIGDQRPPTTLPPRGDIPSSAIESCDDEVIRQLQLLRQTIDHLRREVVDQKSIIDDLRGRLSQCCNRQPAVERCTSSTCYPGY